ncbi:hypothetical protein PIB30_107833, partial [Stylosanthes scabra]|nr:hypothetical protein [Stylosanthes scabra]
IITTRTYDERLKTLEFVRDAGINVCSGGIIGLGEAEEDRVGLLHTLSTRPSHPETESVPINALVAVKGTPLEDQKTLPFFMRDRENSNSRGANYAQNRRVFSRDLDTPPFSVRDRENLNARNDNDGEAEKSYRPMDFVRGVIDKDGQDTLHPYYSNQRETDADYVHIKMLRNNTFVTVTDSKGNIKLSGSVGSVKEMKSGQKLARYAAEATSEVVGRRARGLGLKAVVMKVNGFTHFRRKRQVIMSWLEGFLDSRADKCRNPVVHIEDTTRKPHNGCRLPKKRRI